MRGDSFPGLDAKGKYMNTFNLSGFYEGAALLMNAYLIVFIIAVLLFSSPLGDYSVR